MRDGFPVVDAHAHVFPETTRYYRTTYFPVEHLIASMDAYGVDRSVVLARPTTQLSLVELHAYHTAIARDVSRYADRLTMFGWAAPRLGTGGVEEVRRCFTELGCVGLKLHPAQEQCNIDDAEDDPFVEVAREFNAPVTVHSQLAVRGCEPWRLVTLAERFPDVTFVMAHMGGDGGFVQGNQSARLVRDTPNIVLETSTTVTDPWASFQGPAEVIGPERVILGSDTPHHHVALNLLKLDLLTMDDEWRRLMLGGNMLRILDGVRSAIAPLAV